MYKTDGFVSHKGIADAQELVKWLKMETRKQNDLEHHDISDSKMHKIYGNSTTGEN